MSVFFDRYIELTVNNRSVIGFTGERLLRVVFKSMLDFGGYMSYAEIRIFNIGQSTVNELLKRNSVINLKAGYRNLINTIFQGQIRNVLKSREGPDVVTTLVCRGGSIPRTDIISKTLGGGTLVTSIIRECLATLGYPVIMFDEDFSDVPPYKRGYAIFGDPIEYLDKLAKYHNFKYVIDNEKVIVSRMQRGTGGDAKAVLVSQRTGMEGVPDITEIGCNVKMRLNPNIRMGQMIDVQADLREFNYSNMFFQDIRPNAGFGLYRIFKLSHSGDTHGDEWTTAITAIR